MRETKTLNMIRIVKLWQDNKAPKVYKEASNKLTKEDTKRPSKNFPPAEMVSFQRTQSISFSVLQKMQQNWYCNNKPNS